MAGTATTNLGPLAAVIRQHMTCLTTRRHKRTAVPQPRVATPNLSSPLDTEGEEGDPVPVFTTPMLTLSQVKIINNLHSLKGFTNEGKR